MINKNNSLWPNFKDSPIRTPKNILQEQGSFLSEATDNLLETEVESHAYATQQNNQPKKDRILTRFVIVAPAMNNYRYNLLHAIHEVEIYPLELYSHSQNETFKIDTQEQFLETLTSIFNHEKTVRIIQSLIAQSK